MARFPRRTLLEAAIVTPFGAAALQACSGESLVPSTSDGGAPSDGSIPDAGAPADAGTAIDAGAPPDAGTISDGGTVPDAGAPDAGGACTPTGRDAQGPFYRMGAPARMDLVDAAEPGDRLRITGRVIDASCTPIPSALLDVWQADADGNYDNDDVDFRLRGQLMSAADGTFEIRTVRPGPYLDGGGFRPAHLHFTVTHPARVALTTQLYFAGDPYLSPNDSCGSCSSDDPTLIIDLFDPMDGNYRYQGHFEIVLR